MRNDVLRRSLTATVIVLLGISTAGCFKTFSEARTVVLSRCPELRTYTPEQQRRAAAELRKMPQDSVIALMTADYGTLRARCRAISNGAKQK